MTLDWVLDRPDRQWLALLFAARDAVARFPDREGPVKALMEAQIECGRWSEVRETLAAARARFPDSTAFEPLAERLAQAEAGADSTPNATLEAAARTARSLHDWERVLELCDRSAGTEDTSCIRFHRALAQARLGDPGAVDLQGISPQRDAKVCRPTLQPPWDDFAHFNRTLLCELERLPLLDLSRHRVATRSGRQSETLIPTADGAIEELFRAIRAAGDEFITERAWLMPPANGQPLSISAWAVWYTGAGHQVGHTHPDGWLSFVYCVAAPAGSQARLELGSLAGGPHRDLVAPWTIESLNLSPGDLAIFPSWMPHAATPSGCDGERVVIALDAVPNFTNADAPLP